MTTTKTRKRMGQRPQHLFRRVRDPVVTDASNGASPTVLNLTTDSSGNAVTTIVLCPFGAAGAGVISGTGSSTVFGNTQYFPANLPWLYNQARNFERYRVLNATLIVIGNVGSTATGKVMVDSSTDAGDNLSAITIGTSTGGKVFDLAALSNKEYLFPLDVDSDWKKCSSRLCSYNASGSLFFPISTLNDLAFSNVYVAIVSGSPSGTPSAFNAMSFAVEYDVEFRDPISYGVNY